MSHSSMSAIRNEHAGICAVLRSLPLYLRECRRLSVAPDLPTLRAMLYYLDDFPERIHHQKESDLLFPAIRRRSSESAAVLDRLDRDHSHSHLAIRELEHDLLAIEMTELPDAIAAAWRRFDVAVDGYVADYLAHVHAEEREVLPLAERVLSEGDWVELDAAFAENVDPLSSQDGATSLQPVWNRILRQLPAPLGFGSAIGALRDSYPR